MITMNNHNWKIVFLNASQILGEGEMNIERSVSWCSWTTFERLKCGDSGYWTGGIPKMHEISDWGIEDDSIWRQPFTFESLAHLIIPAEFCSGMGVVKSQRIDLLSDALKELGIPFQDKKFLLEIKLY
jgi:hypothetical protein